MTENTKKSWRELIPPHPAADRFPMMNKEELITLGKDLEKNGLMASIIIWKEHKHTSPMLLDGRNRLAAMEAVGMKIEAENIGTEMDPHIRLWVKSQQIDIIELRGDEGADPFALVVSFNIHRRHLIAKQRRETIAKLLTATPGKSNRQIAEQVKADDKTVGKVRRELEATAEIPQLATTTGKDGKARKPPLKKKRRDIEDYLSEKREKKITAASNSGPVSSAQGIAVSINSGPVSATDQLHYVPKEKWRTLMIARRHFIEVSLAYNCRCLVKFIDDAKLMYRELGFSSTEEMVRDGLGLEPEEIRIAVEWLRLNPQDCHGICELVDDCLRSGVAE